jgi:hypothetical protein
VRILGILFFVLLAAQLAIRYMIPEPRPAWSRIAVIACCVGVVVCLTLPPLVERARRGRDEGSSK